MAKFAVLPHGWFLHLGTNRLYRHAVELTLTRTLIPQMTNGVKQRLVAYTAPELEAKATAVAIAPAANAAVVVEASLSDDDDAPPPNEFVSKLLSASEPSILVTHRKRLKAILKAVRAAKGNSRLKIVGRRPFFRNQTLLIDPDSLTVNVVSIG